MYQWPFMKIGFSSEEVEAKGQRIITREMPHEPPPEGGFFGVFTVQWQTYLFFQELFLRQCLEWLKLEMN